MSKPMSEQMQKLADRYEKATGKKFDVKTNAQKIRGMSDEELAKLLCCTGWRMFEYKECLEWLQMPAEEADHTEDDYFCQKGERKEGADLWTASIIHAHSE